METDAFITDRGRTQPYVVTVGNEKGGTGKSTVALHLAIALLKLGYTVGGIDLDARQATFSTYLANRERFRGDHGEALSVPRYRRVTRSDAPTRAKAEGEEWKALKKAFDELSDCHFVVVDTPGTDSYLSRLGHANADTLITPINDSFLDIDVLAKIDRDKHLVLAPSIYSQMVWEQNNRRAMDGWPPIDWIVMRNRLTHIEARNKREIADLLGLLADRIGFRVMSGFGERVIFRELFPKGLTVLDLAEDPTSPSAAGSRISARRELGQLLDIMGLPQHAALA